MIRRISLALILCGIVSAVGLRPAAAQAPANPGTAASRLKLIADDAQPTITTRSPAPTASPTAGAVPPLPQAPTLNPPTGGAPPRSADPTVPDAVIRGLLDEPRNEPGAAPVPSFPDIRLRARIITADKPATALIEIGGPATRSHPGPRGSTPGSAAEGLRTLSTTTQPSGVFRTIRQGDEFVVPQGDVPTPIRVVKLTADEVVIEVVNRKTLIRLD